MYGCRRVFRRTVRDKRYILHSVYYSCKYTRFVRSSNSTDFKQLCTIILFWFLICEKNISPRQLLLFLLLFVHTQIKLTFVDILIRGPYFFFLKN
jgi:hypothetical protein